MRFSQPFHGCAKAIKIKNKYGDLECGHLRGAIKPRKNMNNSLVLVYTGFTLLAHAFPGALPAPSGHLAFVLPHPPRGQNGLAFDVPDRPRVRADVAFVLPHPPHTGGGALA
jgi:hypothetical protein